MPPKKATKSEPEEYIVDKLVDMKMEGKKKLFLVKWKGFAAKHNTWEPVSNLKEFKDEMDELERSLEEDEEEDDVEDEEEDEGEEEEEEPKKHGKATKKKAVPTASAPPERRAAKESRMAMSEEKQARAAPKRASSSADEEAPAKRAKTASADEKKPPKPRRPAMDVVALASQLKAEIQKKRRPGKEPQEKPPKEKPRRPKKASAEVVEVDKILAVKANVKGGLLYQIQWMDGTKTWEPEDNVMDDDLIDDFEAAEQAKAYSGDEIKVGSDVEVKNVMEGFENSWTAATVTKKEKGGKFTVEFTDFEDEETGEAETESGVERERLRLVPDEAEKGWEPVVGEIIEVNEDGCWWEARVVEVTGKKAKLQLRVSDEYKTATIGAKKLRPCGWLHMAGKRARS